MKHSFILKIDEISIDEISILINILLDNRIKFHVLKSDNKVIKNMNEKIVKFKIDYEKSCENLIGEIYDVKIKNDFLEQKNKKYKEVIDKALELNEKVINMREQGFSYEQYKPYLLKQHNMLKEVKDK